MSIAILDSLGKLELGAGYGLCAATTLLVYDHLVTFEQERRLVWSGRWSVGRALFLFIRYSALPVVVGWFYLEFGRSISNSSCSILMNLLLCAVCIIMFCDALVLGLRTWALWERGMVIGFVLGAAWLVLVALVLVFLVYIIRQELPPSSDHSIPEIPGCGPLRLSASAAASFKLWICVVIPYESLIFILTFAQGFRYLRRPCDLARILYRDAFLGSTTRLVFTILDVLLATYGSTDFYLPFMLSVASYFLIPCRIILNLREATKNVHGWDLASTVSESEIIEQIPATLGDFEGTDRE